MAKLNSVRDAINKMVVSASSSIFSNAIVLISTIFIIQPFVDAQQTPTISYITPNLLSKVISNIFVSTFHVYKYAYTRLQLKYRNVFDPYNCLFNFNKYNFS